MQVVTPASSLTRFVRRFLMTSQGWPYLLVPLIPVAIVLEFMHADAVVCSPLRRWE